MHAEKPLRESDIIFSSATHGIKKALTELKRSNLTISNRLRSIKQDAEFVQRVAGVYQLPLVANERCGSWYIRPANKAGSAYFKSTDGHFGQWSFSLRRLNLQVLDVVCASAGCIIVDSTRRGKSMPDALSKTIPIWICILNRLLFPQEIATHELCTPPQVVSASEHAQIEERTRSMLAAVRSLNLDVDSMRNNLGGRPMQPIWVTPADSLILQLEDKNDKYNRIVLCTASSRDSEEAHGGGQADYVQGAADDHESWACGLDAATFWSHQDRLLVASEDELPGLIEELVATSATDSKTRQPVLVRPTENISIANNAGAQQLYSNYDVVISCDSSPSTALAEVMKSHYIHLTCSAGKNGSRQLRTELMKLSALETILAKGSGQKILVACRTGKDLAVGVALAIICRFADSNGRTRHGGNAANVLNKELVKQRLSWIMVSMPDASPSRATLQSVNAFLLS